MIKNKKMWSLFIVLTLLLCMMPVIRVHAQGEDIRRSQVVSIENFPDGSSVIELLELPSNPAKGTVTGSKTRIFRNSSKQPMWFEKITGTFHYTGQMVSLTGSTMDYGSYDHEWKIYYAHKSTNGASATTTVRARLIIDGDVMDDKMLSVTISCDKNGNLY